MSPRKTVLRPELSSSDLLAAYMDDMRKRGLSPNTLNTRQWCLGAFIREVDVPRATREVIESFLDGRNLGPVSRNLLTSHISSFYKFLVEDKYLLVDPTLRIRRPKVPQRLPRPISDLDLLKALDHAGADLKLWLLMGAYGGLRCQEIAGIRREDILWQQKLLRIANAKGGRERMIPLHPEIYAVLRKYPLPERGPIFRMKSGLPVRPNYVSGTISKFFQRWEIDANAHALRHWFATRLLATTHDLRVVGETLGHRSFSSTLVYADWDREVAKAGIWALRADPASTLGQPETPKPAPAWAIRATKKVQAQRARNLKKVQGASQTPKA